MSQDDISFDSLTIGQEFPSSTYRLSAETIVKYLEALGDNNSLYRDERIVREFGLGGKIAAPPTIAAVWTIPAVILQGVKWPPGGIHAKQEYEFLKPASDGDVLTTSLRVGDKYLKNERKYVVLELKTVNQKGEPILRGKMTTIMAK